MYRIGISVHSVLPVTMLVISVYRDVGISVYTLIPKDVGISVYTLILKDAGV